MLSPEIIQDNQIIEKISLFLAREEKPITIQKLQKYVKIPYLNLISLLNTMHRKDLIDMYNPKKDRSNVNLKKRAETLEFCPVCYNIIYIRNHKENSMYCEECNIEFTINSPQ